MRVTTKITPPTDTSDGSSRGASGMRDTTKIDTPTVYHQEGSWPVCCNNNKIVVRGSFHDEPSEVHFISRRVYLIDPPTDEMNL